MNFRKLRITWTVFCGIACVLLIVLWVRSYWWADFCEGSIGSHWIKVESLGGQFVLKHYEFQHGPGSLHSYPIEEIASKAFILERGIPKFELGLGVLFFPYWALVLSCLVGTVEPWLSWRSKRFSLRTLLIATTLVAVVLGLIVWLR
jgi:hypothetical protein